VISDSLETLLIEHNRSTFNGGLMKVIWEYRYLSFPTDYQFAQNPHRRLTSPEMLNLLGSEGWELVCKDEDRDFIFKRPKLTPDSQPEQEDVALNPALKMVATHRNIAIEVSEFQYKERVFYKAIAVVKGFSLGGIAADKEAAIKMTKKAIDDRIEALVSGELTAK